MGKDSSQFLTSLYLGSLSILSFSSCNAESITVFGTPINSPIKYKGVLFDLDSCAIFMSKKSYVKQTGHGYSIARRPVSYFLFFLFPFGKNGNAGIIFFTMAPAPPEGLGSGSQVRSFQLIFSPR